MKKIVQKNDKVLRLTAREVPHDAIKSVKIQKMLVDMHEALSGESDGVALAAPQISESFRIFVLSNLAYHSVKYKKERHLVFINPVLTKKSRDRKLMEEGCLSVRPLYGKVRRSSRVTITAYDENGEKFEMTETGLLAQIFQHEVDHLDGILFIDKAKDIIEMHGAEFEPK